jgi:hypothetical protein
MTPDAAARVRRCRAPSRCARRFRVEGALPPAGRYKWVLVVDAPGLADRHDLASTTVFADRRRRRPTREKQPEDDPSAISYLKEQQWTNAFATARVREARCGADPRAGGRSQPSPAAKAIVGAPAAGGLRPTR